MTDVTRIIPATQPAPLSQRYSTTSEAQSLSIELAKCLRLVAPASMGSDDQASWILAAIDALEDIRANEVASVSAELRRSVTRPAQIVPEIARLVDEKRKRARLASDVGDVNQAWPIDQESHERRSRARNRDEIKAAADWERQARIAAGLAAPPIQPPLSREELANLPEHIAKLGLAYGFLEKRDGRLVEA